MLFFVVYCECVIGRKGDITVAQAQTIKQWRKTTQHLLPRINDIVSSTKYQLYPVHTLSKEQISAGFSSLAKYLKNKHMVMIDGYIGVLWTDFQEQLNFELDMNIQWLNLADYMLPESTINDLIAPYLGGDDPIFGKRTDLTLSDFFDMNALLDVKIDKVVDITIAYGCGASLLNWNDGFLVYLDLPKNEIQFRSRAKAVSNLGQQIPTEPKPAYKRFYFVDWVVLNQHKASLTPSIDLIVDVQDKDTPMMMQGDDFRAALDQLSQTVFRVRPWFEPGAWGGQWLKEHLTDLPQDAPNYAWSFEMIAPEQGIIFGDEQHLMEVSFDFLMYHNVDAILGKYQQYFGYEFPVRFDFLDTIEGGNLSIQCHPRPAFIREQFGEHFTQDETYYMLECEPDASVYLGFQEGIEPDKFRDALETSYENTTEIAITDFVQQFPAKKHDLFLIPNGTIHASGHGTLVLEISATPYIFTFKMYDWLRVDLDGKPRPINIERAFANLYFDRQGESVATELLSQPKQIDAGNGYRVIHVPTHDVHFYDIERYEISSSVSVSTNDSVQILMVVEGESVIVEVGGIQQQYNYAETFIIPAAAEQYQLINANKTEVKVVRAFMKQAWFEKEENQWLSLP